LTDDLIKILDVIINNQFEIDVNCNYHEKEEKNTKYRESATFVDYSDIFPVVYNL
jgi:hypothetical protein